MQRLCLQGSHQVSVSCSLSFCVRTIVDHDMIRATRVHTLSAVLEYTEEKRYLQASETTNNQRGLFLCVCMRVNKEASVRSILGNLALRAQTTIISFLSNSGPYNQQFVVCPCWKLFPVDMFRSIISTWVLVLVRVLVVNWCRNDSLLCSENCVTVCVCVCVMLSGQIERTVKWLSICVWAGKEGASMCVCACVHVCLLN